VHFVYHAIGPSGHPLTDRAEAANAQDLIKALGKQGYQVYDVQPDFKATLLAMFKRKQVKRAVLVDFCNYMKGLLALGLNVNAAIETVQESMDDELLRGGLKQVKDLVEKGFALSEALEQTGLFPPLVLASITAGENSNRLEAVFGDLGDHYKNIEALASDAKKAAMYPLTALVVLVAVLMMMLLVVVPQLKDILPPDPPLPTRILLFMSDSLGVSWWAFPVLPFAFIAGYKKLTPRQRAKVGSIIYKLPLVGRISRNLELSTVFMNLAMLNAGGIPVLETMRLVIEATRSPLLKDKLTYCYEMTSKGGTLSEGFRDPLFPPLVASAIHHGEATGKFAPQFAGIATLLRERATQQIRLVSTFIEPALILVGGGMMLMMALAIFLPIYGQLRQQMGR
jgi:type II secretory pathway component PulF